MFRKLKDLSVKSKVIVYLITIFIFVAVNGLLQLNITFKVSDASGTMDLLHILVTLLSMSAYMVTVLFLIVAPFSLLPIEKLLGKSKESILLKISKYCKIILIICMIITLNIVLF